MGEAGAHIDDAYNFFFERENEGEYKLTVEIQPDKEYLTYREIQQLIRAFMFFGFEWRNEGWIPSFDLELIRVNGGGQGVHANGSLVIGGGGGVQFGTATY